MREMCGYLLLLAAAALVSTTTAEPAWSWPDGRSSSSSPSSSSSSSSSASSTTPAVSGRRLADEPARQRYAITDPDSDDFTLPHPEDLGPNRPLIRPPSYGGGSNYPQRPFGGGSNYPQRPFGGGSSYPQRPFGGESNYPQRPFGGDSNYPQRPFGGDSNYPQRPFGGDSNYPQRPFGGDSNYPQRPLNPLGPIGGNRYPVDRFEPGGAPGDVSKCKCVHSLNCAGNALQFGSCDAGKHYCCSKEPSNAGPRPGSYGAGGPGGPGGAGYYGKPAILVGPSKDDRYGRYPGPEPYDRYPGSTGSFGAPGVLVGPRPTPYRPDPAAGFASRPYRP